MSETQAELQSALETLALLAQQRATIAPLDDKTLVEACVKPSDIAFKYLGQPVLADKKTVLDYLIRPVIRVKENALRE